MLLTTLEIEPSFGTIAQLLHGCRQLVPWGVPLSGATSATPILCWIFTEDCPPNRREEGGDDVKSAWCLYPGRHTSYNEKLQRVAKSRDGANPIKSSLSGDCRLKLACMNEELVVIANQQVAVNTFSPLAHTARQMSKAGGSRNFPLGELSWT